MDKNKRERARYLLSDEVAKATSDEALDFNFDLIESEVLNYCNRPDFPPGLMLIVIKMVAAYTMAEYYKMKEVEKISNPTKNTDRVAKSITRGDTTISYGEEGKITEYGSPANAFISVSGFIEDYQSQLRDYRRLRTLYDNTYL